MKFPTIRFRWYQPGDPPIQLGNFIAAERGRRCFLIHGINDRGLKGGQLGSPKYRLLVLTVESLPRSHLAEPGARVHTIVWDSRRRSRPPRSPAP